MLTFPICSQEWRNGRRAGFRCLLWQHSVGSSPISCIPEQLIRGLRKCRNWQTSKTKDLVVDTPCGFKSHLPHKKTGNFCFRSFFINQLLFVISYYLLSDRLFSPCSRSAWPLLYMLRPLRAASFLSGKVQEPSGEKDTGSDPSPQGLA